MARNCCAGDLLLRSLPLARVSVELLRIHCGGWRGERMNWALDVLGIEAELFGWYLPGGESVALEWSAPRSTF